MGNRFVICCLLFCCFTLKSLAQVNSELVQSRVLILLDESSSMIDLWTGDKPKYKVAREIILKIMDSVYAYNSEVEFSLRVFGHQHTVKENNCYDTKNEVSFTKSNRGQMELRLMDIRPLGVTPIAYALRQAAEWDLIDEVHNAYSIILVTDGGESCGGDICAVMRSLIANKVFFKPYIVGLEDAPELRDAYQCMGNYLSVTKELDIPNAVSKIVETFKPIIKVTKTEFSEIKTLGINAPSVLKVSTPNPIKNVEKNSETLKTEPPAPKENKITKPVVSAINHLAVAPIIVYDPIPVESEKLNLKKVPQIAEEEIAKIFLPHVDKIEHLFPAELIELKGTELHAVIIKKARMPIVTDVVLELPDLPKVTVIKHLEPLDLTNFDDTKSEMKHVKKVNQIIEVKEDLPVVLNIMHLSPYEPKIQKIEAPKPEMIAKADKIPTIDIKDEVVLPKVANISHINVAKIKIYEGLIASTEPIKLVKPISPPIEERETQILPKVANINHLNMAKLRSVNSESIPIIPIKQVSGNIPAVVYKDIVPLPIVDRISRIKPAKIIEPRLIFLVEEHVPRLRTPPDPPTSVPIPVAKLNISKPTIEPAKPKVAPGITSGYTIETIDAKETSLMVYFTNGHGKFYNSTPMVVLLEPFSNKIAKKFYRTLDPEGVPDIQKDIPVGTFNIAIADKRNLVLHDVEIKPNKLNKVIVKLKNCSLSFEYDNTTTRPVSEFHAVVIERNVPNGKITDQKCTQKLEYEPGNYHITIFTYPKLERNVDLDFDDTKVINLPQPGFVKFNTELKNRKLTLCQTVNDRFLPFDSKNSSDTVLHHLQIQPGQYQVHYLKDPSRPYSKEVVIQFAIKSNEVTEVNLP